MIIGFGKESPADLQKYAAKKLFNAINIPHVHENLLCIGAFIISEYSNYLVEAGKEPKKLYETIHRHYSYTSEKTRAIILNAYAKLAAKYEDIRDEIKETFTSCSEHFDPELQ